MKDNIENKKAGADKFPEMFLQKKGMSSHESHIAILKDDLEGYEKVGHRKRDQFVWFLKAFENLGISTVEKQYLDSLAITKTRLAMFDILIDDKVDNPQARNFDLVEFLSKIPFIIFV